MILFLEHFVKFGAAFYFILLIVLLPIYGNLEIFERIFYCSLKILHDFLRRVVPYRTSESTGFPIWQPAYLSVLKL